MKARRQGFSQGTPVSSLLHRFNGSGNEIKLKINAISALSNLIVDLSLRATWYATRHVARDKRLMCCTWFAHYCALAT